MISGALLASDQLISVPLSVVAVFLGIFSGDLALYGMGRLALKSRAIRGWILTNPKARQLRKRFRQKTFSNIFIVRFIPGLRTLGFSMCGLWKVPLPRFLLAMGGAGIIWICLIFSLVYSAGSSEWLENSPWKWSLMFIAALLLLMNNVWAMRSGKR